MFKLLLRFVFFIVGVLLLLDAGLPTATQEMQVDRHTSHTDRNSSRTNITHDTSYNVEFAGGHVTSCSVGYVAYNKLNDGDTVTVKSSKIFGQCIHIGRGDEEIYQNRFWKFFMLGGGLVLIAIAFGWIESSDDNEDRPGIWFRL